jgi:hypothetical protein
MAFKVMQLSSLLSGSGSGSGSGNNPNPETEIALPVTFNANGVSAFVLPDRANINKMFLVATAAITFRMGITGDEELLIPDTAFTPGVTESFLTFPFLPNSITIRVGGIAAGQVSGTIYYQIIP